MTFLEAAGAILAIGIVGTAAIVGMARLVERRASVPARPDEAWGDTTGVGGRRDG